MSNRLRSQDREAVLGTVTRRASSVFTGAIRRYGLTAEDIVMEGAAKLLASGTSVGAVPPPELLWWAAHNAGLDMIRASARQAGDRRPGRVGLAWGTVTSGDEIGLAELRRVLAERPPALVSLSTGDHRPGDEPVADGDVVRPDELAWEAVCWGLVADHIRREVRSRLPAIADRRGDPRTRFAALSDRTAYGVARRATADVELRRAYAEQPGLTVWGVARQLAPGELGASVADRFPPRTRGAERRHAFRLVRRVVTTIGRAHRAVQAQVRSDGDDGSDVEVGIEVAR